MKNRKRARSWLFHAAKIEADDYLRAKRMEFSFEEMESDLSTELLAEETKDLLEILLNKEQSDQVVAALGLLSPRYQQVVKLWAMGNLSQRDIARVMGMNRNTVRICLRRGLKAFRKAYASLNDEEEKQ